MTTRADLTTLQDFRKGATERRVPPPSRAASQRGQSTRDTIAARSSGPCSALFFFLLPFIFSLPSSLFRLLRCPFWLFASLSLLLASGFLLLESCFFLLLPPFCSLLSSCFPLFFLLSLLFCPLPTCLFPLAPCTFHLSSIFRLLTASFFLFCALPSVYLLRRPFLFRLSPFSPLPSLLLAPFSSFFRPFLFLFPPPCSIWRPENGCPSRGTPSAPETVSHPRTQRDAGGYSRTRIGGYMHKY